MNRREFIRLSLWAGGVMSVGASARAIAARAGAPPVKIAHREGNMLRTSSPGVYELASKIPGLSGSEVQTTRSKVEPREEDTGADGERAGPAARRIDRPRRRRISQRPRRTYRFRACRWTSSSGTS